MGIACWVYIAGLFLYEFFSGNAVSVNVKTYYILGFTLASLILFYIAWWHRKNPATYEATITTERFIVDYPSYPEWCFDVNIFNIKRFEYRQTLGHTGRGNSQQGVLMNDGSFHNISVNYGNNLNHMYKAVRQTNPEVVFPNSVNTKVLGFLKKDYDA
jgi:hypothetical protein